MSSFCCPSTCELLSNNWNTVGTSGHAPADLFRELLMGLWLLFLSWTADVACCWNVVLVNCGAVGSVNLIDAVRNLVVASLDVTPLPVVAVVVVNVTCSGCCCSCCNRNSSCWRRSTISSRSFSNSNCRSRSCCSVSFLALRFSSSISSICRLLDDRELAILGCFLLPCVAECLEDTSTFPSAFSIAQFPVSITVSFWFFITSWCGWN